MPAKNRVAIKCIPPIELLSSRKGNYLDALSMGQLKTNNASAN